MASHLAVNVVLPWFWSCISTVVLAPVPHAALNRRQKASRSQWLTKVRASTAAGYQADPPAAVGRKVVLNDTDHSFYYVALQKAGLDAQRAWVWKNFTRGHQALFMDPYLDPTPWGVVGRNKPKDGKHDPYWEVLRLNMGYTRTYADRMNLAAMTPQPALASSGFCPRWCRWTTGSSSTRARRRGRAAGPSGARTAGRSTASRLNGAWRRSGRSTSTATC